MRKPTRSAPYQWVSLPSDIGLVAIKDERATNYLLSGRVRAEYRILPGWLALRLRGDGRVFQITREKLGIQVGATVDATQAVERWRQIEASARLFVDADVLKIERFVPALYGGIDALVLSSDEEMLRTVVPVFGVGVRREVF